MIIQYCISARCTAHEERISSDVSAFCTLAFSAVRRHQRNMPIACDNDHVHGTARGGGHCVDERSKAPTAWLS